MTPVSRTSPTRVEGGARTGEQKPDGVEDSKKPPKPGRKPYSPPKLDVWGTLEDLTRTVGRTRGTDNGTIKNQKQTRP